MEPIFTLPADLPGHRDTTLAPVPAEIVCEWPSGTFVENLAFLADHTLAVSVHSESRVERVDGFGHRSVMTALPVPPAGLVARANGGFYVAGGAPGSAPGRVWRVDANGKAELAITVSDALFLNGLTPLSETTLLAADSILGRIYSLDLRANTAAIWFEGEMLRKITSFPYMPGANGIKVFGGEVYVTNTDRATLVKIPVAPDGGAGEARVIARELRGDDFAFDAEGAAYIATHIENTLVRYSFSGERISIAGPDQWMPGSTAAAFGRSTDNQSSLYVTTTGGIMRPFEGTMQTAKLVRLHTSAKGFTLPLAI